MARAESTDFYQNFRFHVKDPSGGFLAPLAGFSAVTTPQYTTEAAEYREGTYIYTRKQTGVPSTEDITLSQGVARRDSDFFNWARTAIEGGEYRTDLVIGHFHRADRPLNPIGTPSKVYQIFDAFPVRMKIAGDLDGTSGDISIAELDLAYEHFTVATTVTPGVV